MPTFTTTTFKVVGMTTNGNHSHKDPAISLLTTGAAVCSSSVCGTSIESMCGVELASYSYWVRRPYPGLCDLTPYNDGLWVSICAV